jgi:hypothetical protein
MWIKKIELIFFQSFKKNIEKKFEKKNT